MDNEYSLEVKSSCRFTFINVFKSSNQELIIRGFLHPGASSGNLVLYNTDYANAKKFLEEKLPIKWVTYNP